MVDGVEGQKDVCSYPSARALKSQLAEQPLTGGRWNLPKKDTPCPKTKKQQQWDGRRGTIVINQIPFPSWGWPTNWRTIIPNNINTQRTIPKNNNTKEVLPLLWRFRTLLQAFPIYLPWSDGAGCHHLSFLNVEF